VSAPQRSLSQTKQEAEILRITQALKKNRNNRLRTAAELGISRMALYKKLHKYGMINSA
jgi:transcriptional regulator with PAS, ATPase and Fis domain